MAGNAKYYEKLKSFGFLAKKQSKARPLNADVLLVDDCKLQQHVISQFLSEFGLSATCVGSVNEALQYIASLDNTNLLISDIELPDKSGLKLVKAIQAYHKDKSIPSIAVSSNQNYKASALNAGFDVFINKPASKQTIGNALNNLGMNVSIARCTGRK